MLPSESLQEHMRYKMGQELCDEVDAAFRLIKRQAETIDELRADVLCYRTIAGFHSNDPVPAKVETPT